ncbi:MAG: hypothetical protein CVU63_00560 [Deltaproteobacteria bacterium HGW-Deltaproteobacteria-20]|jgi:hypothetical protein|nr:MAG: hypothetical protein CVU63_00560 [Deltaproteobacteria bacterium HGW-Deltaproteobacteria-20]
MLRRCALFVLVVCPACETFKADPSPTVGASASAVPTMDPCVELRARFRQLHEAAGMHCTANTDCTCGPGGIDPAGCGQIMNRESAERLLPLYREVAKRCGLDRRCAPSRCLAACQNGTCTRLSDTPDVALPRSPVP